MTFTKYSILVIEDNPGDFALVEDFLLEQFESPNITQAVNYNEAKTLLCGGALFNVILLDLSLPDKTGEDLIREVMAIADNMPVIVFTGYTDFSFGAKSLSLGVSDYILKDELTSISLAKSIIYSQERKKAIAALEESEKKYSELFHLSPVPMWVFDIETLEFLDVNLAAVELYGYERDEFLSMTIKEIRLPEDIPELEARRALSNANNSKHVHAINRHLKKNGDVIFVEIQGDLIGYKDRAAKIILATDVTERINYVKAIEEQNERLKEISWIQSHVVRAPLARILGLIPLIADIGKDDEDKEKILTYLTQSANELDEVVKNIVKKAHKVNANNHNIKPEVKMPQAPITTK